MSIIKNSVWTLIAVSSGVLAAEPTPPSVPPPPPPSPWSIKGFVQLRGIGASHQMQSFSQNNLSAVTAVSNPVLADAPESFRSSLQVAQSRLLGEYRPIPNVLGRFEFDFVDFSKSTPTTAALPRVRRAAIEYQPSGGDWHFLFGQDWDLISPLAPFTYNWVSHAFEAGDIGFMRLQAQARYDLSATNELGMALAYPKSNVTSSDNVDETATLPVLEARYRYHQDSIQAGVSGLWARLKTDTTTKKRAQTWTANAFLEVKVGERFTVRTETYVGQNVAGVGLLGLSQANATYGSPREWGAFISPRLKTSDTTALYALVGAAHAVDHHAVAPLYARSAGTVRAAGNGPGILWNGAAMLGIDHEIEPKLHLFFQSSYMKTRHALLAEDRALRNSVQAGVVGECGVQLDL